MRVTVTVSQLWTIAKAMVVSAIVCASPAAADPTRKLIGLSEEELLSCAGIPAAQMASGNKTFLQYGEFGERGAVLPLGNMLFLTKKEKGCQAIITLEDGIVRKVTLKTKGLISGPLACDKIFSEC